VDYTLKYLYVKKSKSIFLPAVQSSPKQSSGGSRKGEKKKAPGVYLPPTPEMHHALTKRVHVEYQVRKREEELFNR
jgi:hypothetical protein